MPPLALVLVLGLMTPAVAEEVRPKVVDGHTLEIEGTLVRLFGIEAPEREQTCRVPQGRWSCGEFSRSALQDLIRNRTVTCTQVDAGRYAGLTVARCTVGGRDIGAAMVAGGWALAQHSASPDYVPLETRARTSGAGVWRGEQTGFGYLQNR
jgi:endonuclease YncB( thermonuclease family)